MEVARANEYSECSTSDFFDDSCEVVYCGASSGTLTTGRKREYGDGDGDGGGGAAVAVVQQPERRVRSRLEEQFVLLREAVPNLRTDERASILDGAFDYIERLQRQEAELLCELEEDDSETSCCEDDGVSCSSCKVEEADEERPTVDHQSGGDCAGSDCGSCSSVEVVRTEAGLRIRVECAMKPGLLLAIMELLESHNLSVEEANIECVERFIFTGIGLDQELDEETRVSAEVLGASLRLLLCSPDQRQGMNATVEKDAALQAP